MMNDKHHRLAWLGALVLWILAACKKDQDVQSSAPAPALPPFSISDQLKDSALAYARDIYFWYQQIPSDFNARAYADPDKIMKAIRPYSRREAGFENESVDRWSFGILKKDWDNISSGIAGDFGLGIKYKAAEDLRISYVEKNSPAGQKGIRRGWRIIKINGNSNVSYSNVDFVSSNVYRSSSTTFTFQKPDGSVVDVTLNAATYQEDPIFFEGVYNISNKKIGYLVFNSFLGDTTKIYNEFNRIFSRFASENVQDVVVDLRYNGGGYVTVQNKLANYLAPPSANGGVMMKQQFNDKYSEYNSTAYFRKQGALNVNRVFFITGSGTASASELLINNLKPYMSVKTIGDTSYGKPVGYFNIPVGEWYVFPVSFKSVNKNNEGNYYSGFIPDAPAPDGLDKDWGDVTEEGFATVVAYITNGSYRHRPGTTYTEDARVSRANTFELDKRFRGTIDPRKTFR